ncbi:MAG TPA: chemotaxis protein CheW [Jatrophihabitans sp.]|nr:chemotaxis protein CheW [Jatrophihabitans sp.]
MDVVVLPVGGDSYAIAAKCVRLVVSVPKLTPLVTAPRTVLGLFNLRGEIAPLLDTAALLGIGTLDNVRYAVVVETPDGPAGIAASGFPSRAVLGEAAGGAELPAATASYLLDGRVAVLIDVPTLLASDRLGGTAGLS